MFACLLKEQELLTPGGAAKSLRLFDRPPAAVCNSCDREIAFHVPPNFKLSEELVMRGRKPKPTHLKLVEGNPGKRKLNRKEPVPRNKLLSPPEYLNEEQRATWSYLTANSPKGMLKALDAGLLAAYVVAVCIHREATVKLQNSPMILKATSGAPVQSPYVKILSTQARLIASLGSELGFSPASRTRIAVEQEHEPDPLDRFFNDFQD